MTPRPDEDAQRIAEPRRSLTIGGGMALIAAVACSLALARVPMVWHALDAGRSGMLVAQLRYVWLWAGLVLAAALIRTPSGRLAAYGWVLFGSFAIPMPFPHLDLGLMVDIPAYWNQATILAAVALWLAAWILRRFESRSRGKVDPS